MANPTPLRTELWIGDDLESRLIVYLGDESRELTAEEALELAAHLTAKVRQMMTNERPAWMDVALAVG